MQVIFPPSLSGYGGRFPWERHELIIMVRKILSATIITIVLTIVGITIQTYVLGGDNVRKEVIKNSITTNSSVATTESSRDKSSTSNDIIIMTTTQPTRPTVTSSGYVLALDY